MTYHACPAEKAAIRTTSAFPGYSAGMEWLSFTLGAPAPHSAAAPFSSFPPALHPALQLRPLRFGTHEDQLRAWRLRLPARSFFLISANATSSKRDLWRFIE
jgi:hypothetical protein